MARLKYKGEEIDVEYDTVGDYVPATYDQPAEWPETIINAVYYNDVDIYSILHHEDLDYVYELLNEYLYG